MFIEAGSSLMTENVLNKLKCQLCKGPSRFKEKVRAISTSFTFISTENLVLVTGEKVMRKYEH